MKKNNINKINDDIVLSFQNGSEDAFNQIFDHYHNTVYFIAYELTQDKALSEDMVQEIFVKIHQNKEALNEPKAFHVWLKRIAYTQCIDYLRKINKYKYDTYEDVLLNIEDEKNITMDKALLDEYVKNKIFETINELPFEQKTIILLRFYEGLSVKETAEILNIKENHVRVQTHRIKGRLKELLEKKDVTPTIYKSFTISILPLVLEQCASTIHMEQSVTMHVWNEITSKTSNLKSMGFMQSHKVAIGSSVATLAIFSAIVVGMGYMNQDEKPKVKVAKPVEEVYVPPVEELATISKVEYDSNWVNHKIDLNCITTNDNYDEILVNGVNTKEILSNGEYTVSIVKDGKVIDTQNITISNIDFQEPILISKGLSGNIYTINFEEKESGIGNIRFLVNNTESNDYVLNNNQLSFKVIYGNSYYIEIGDHAGNALINEVAKN